MKNFLFFLVVLFVTINSSGASGLNDAGNKMTMDLFLRSESTYSSLKVAALHWLPDYQEKLNSRSNGSGIEEKAKTCADIGGVLSCSAFQVGFTIPNIYGLTCYSDCKCPHNYVRSCASGSEPAGNVCNDKDGNKYERCQSCPAVSLCLATEYKKIIDSSQIVGGVVCKQCVAMTAAEKCIQDGYVRGKTCENGQTTEACGYDSSYVKCTGEMCPIGLNCKSGKCATLIPAASVCGDVCETCEPECSPAVTCKATEICKQTCDGKCRECGCADGSLNIGTSWCNEGLKCLFNVTTQTCIAPNLMDCNALGYTRDASSCVARTQKLRCPFDNNRYACQLMVP